MKNIIIVGAGPAGIFAAYQLITSSVVTPKITIFEEGNDINKRRCPKTRTGKCVNCDPCAITTGFSGAGAFSDGICYGSLLC